ncbi:SdpI family protein [Actinomadura sp. NAK00032]|uniref:SdpI family protein n=1 Tax=Actinomadura sp. NAK00032 TaxID=2742128 RepID=UPI001590B1F3|nr:SdpI family protein [Actinomadura sp. NAK00032]QKW37732.1 SdpI family protein [Actinomadura sp. NAK00032]
MAITGIILIASGVLVAVVGRLGATGRIQRNGLIGIRTRRSMADDESWLVVHRRAQPWMHASGASLIATGAVAIATGSNEPVAAVTTLVGVVACALFAVAGTAAGHRELARRDLPK